MLPERGEPLDQSATVLEPIRESNDISSSRQSLQQLLQSESRHTDRSNQRRQSHLLSNNSIRERRKKQHHVDAPTVLMRIARTVALLKEYKTKYRMPTGGDHRDQEFILREINKELYAGGVPIWVLADLLTRAAEALLGKPEINFWILPQKTVMFAPNSGTSGITSMFSTVRGFAMYRLDRMEPIAIRLASFASCSTSDPSQKMKSFHPDELRKAATTCSPTSLSSSSDSMFDEGNVLQGREQLASEILHLASETQGWFSFLSCKNFTMDVDCEGDPINASFYADASLRELFFRLVAQEAKESILQINRDPYVEYPILLIIFFRMASTAGACAFWFNGSWKDMIAASFLALIVALFKVTSLISIPERIALEVIASFLVGLTAAVVDFHISETCFGAMALAGVLDILHGFKVVFAVMEIMSRHTVAGVANFAEGILFTFVITYSLKSGQVVASVIFGSKAIASTDLDCDAGISEWWYLLLVPISAISWSGLFSPSNSVELFFMGLHGCLGFVVSWAASHADASSMNLNNFLASLSVTLSAGIIARWTGRQAIGNIVAGIFGLVPGAYLIRGMYSEDVTNFIQSTISRCIMIGVGAWLGILLGSPASCMKPSSVFCSKQAEQPSEQRTIKDSNPKLFF